MNNIKYNKHILKKSGIKTLDIVSVPPVRLPETDYYEYYYMYAPGDVIVACKNINHTIKKVN